MKTIKDLKKEKWVVLERVPNYYPMVTYNAVNIKKSNKFLKELGYKNKLSACLLPYENDEVGLFF